MPPRRTSTRDQTNHGRHQGRHQRESERACALTIYHYLSRLYFRAVTAKPVSLAGDTARPRDHPQQWGKTRHDKGAWRRRERGRRAFLYLDPTNPYSFLGVRGPGGLRFRGTPIPPTVQSSPPDPPSTPDHLMPSMPCYYYHCEPPNMTHASPSHLIPCYAVHAVVSCAPRSRHPAGVKAAHADHTPRARFPPAPAKNQESTHSR